jgi:ribosomal protein L11 methyltransferase
MKYFEVKIYTTKEGIDPLTCILTDIGIAGFVIEDPQDFSELLEKKNSYDWDYVDESLMDLAHIETNITFYLDVNEEGNSKLQEVKRQIEKLKERTVPSSSFSPFGKVDFGSLVLETQLIADDEWKDKWKEYFKPAKVSDKIVIKPSWESYQKQEDDELVIEIDPGMAFGTGTHPTTSLCIRLMEKYMTQEDMILDVGCGSGILSIAAALLGAGKVLGIEIDPIAVAVSKDNVTLNGLDDKIEIQEGDLVKGLNFKACK